LVNFNDNTVSALLDAEAGASGEADFPVGSAISIALGT
jgi:hypothetical protein